MSLQNLDRPAPTITVALTRPAAILTMAALKHWRAVCPMPAEVEAELVKVVRDIEEGTIYYDQKEAERERI